MSEQSFLLISNLNEILAETINARLRFHAVARHVTDERLKRICNNIALQRLSYIGEIEAAIRELGGRPDERGTALGKAHRSWIAIRSLLTDSPVSILQECIRGERFVVDQHTGMLQHTDLPEYVQAALKRHLHHVETDLSRLEKIKKFYERDET